MLNTIKHTENYTDLKRQGVGRDFYTDFKYTAQIGKVNWYL